MTAAIRPEGPDPSRRDFVKTLGAAALAPTFGPLVPTSAAETTVARFHQSLSDDQREWICFPWNHPLRVQVGDNRAIVRPRIRDLNPDQHALCREIFQNLCSDDGHDRFLRQMREDGGGFGNYHVALFGTPGSGTPCEWVITGRHVTLRTDGHSCAGPIFYGHGRHSGNVWGFQAARADAIFKSLDHAQRASALGSVGLPMGDLDGSQTAMVHRLLRDMLRPYRSFDESFLHDADTLHLTYFPQGEHGSHGFHDIWKLEGPSFSWYYHGSPHVHAWLDIDRTPSLT